MTIQLPIKRIYDPKSRRIRKSIVFPENDKDLANCSSSQDRITAKIKMTGINFGLDFDEHDQLVVPGKGIIVKPQWIPLTIESLLKYNSKQKYLVFPFTTCKLENQHLDKSCKCRLEYGKDIDGGLREVMNIPHQLLIPIPQNISLHDACFVTEILLPFYTNINKVNLSSATSKTLILLNDIRKEINEILIILKHFHIPQSSIVFLDNATIYNLKHPSSYSSRFQTVFCFNKSLLKFAEFSCISTGAPLNKSRYNIFTNFPISNNSIDKTYHSMTLTYNDKFACQEVLDILSHLNTETELLNSVSPVVPIANSTCDTNSCSSTSSSNSNSNSNSNSPSPHFAWVWHEKDFDLINFEDLAVDEVPKHERTYQTIDDMNRLVKSGTLSRICYINRKNKKKNTNLFLRI